MIASRRSGANQARTSIWIGERKGLQLSPLVLTTLADTFELREAPAWALQWRCE